MKTITDTQRKQLTDLAQCTLGFKRNFAENVLKQNNISDKQCLLLRKLYGQWIRSLRPTSDDGECLTDIEQFSDPYEALNRW